MEVSGRFDKLPALLAEVQQQRRQRAAGDPARWEGRAPLRTPRPASPASSATGTLHTPQQELQVRSTASSHRTAEHTCLRPHICTGTYHSACAPMQACNVWVQARLCEGNIMWRKREGCRCIPVREFGLAYCSVSLPSM